MADIMGPGQFRPPRFTVDGVELLLRRMAWDISTGDVGHLSLDAYAPTELEYADMVNGSADVELRLEWLDGQYIIFRGVRDDG